VATDLTISGDRFVKKEQLIINYLKSKGFHVKLSILVENRNVANNCPINNESKTFFYITRVYLDIINLIRSSDICVTYGAGPFPGNGLNI